MRWETTTLFGGGQVCRSLPTRTPTSARIRFTVNARACPPHGWPQRRYPSNLATPIGGLFFKLFGLEVMRHQLSGERAHHVPETNTASISVSLTFHTSKYGEVDGQVGGQVAQGEGHGCI